MSTIEIVAGGLLVVCCILIIGFVMAQSSKSGGLTSAIMGGDSGSFRGRGKDSDIRKAAITKWLAIVLFIVTLAVNFISLYVNSLPVVE